jgi:DNA-binding NarL/FixJ family response regulator
MRNNPIHIVLADTSQVVTAGLKEVLGRSEQRFEFYLAENLDAVQSLIQNRATDLVLINPGLVRNLEKQLLQIKNEEPAVKWLALVYAWHEDALMAMFDARVQLNDPPDTIISTIQGCMDQERPEEAAGRQALSDREIEVLHLLVMGLSNKEIADKLFISTYTVISHRKNITQKTGIKSVSGLTIYAVVKGIITLNSLPE